MKIINLLAIAGLLALGLARADAQIGTSPAKVEQPWYQQGKISGGISVGSSSAATALPAAGLVAWICNTGAVDTYLAFGTSNAVSTASSTGTWLKASTCGSYDLFPASVSASFTFIATISASASTLTLETGIGTPPTQSASSSGTGTAVTNSGTFAVQNTAATPAGTALMGKVGIDQTTPGTTNGVQLTGTGQVAVSVAPVTATNTATVVDLRPDSPGIVVLGQTTKSASVPVTTASDQLGGATVAASYPQIITSQYPVNSVTTAPTPLVAKGTGTTGAVTGTLTPAATATAYICGFSFSAIGGTANPGPLVLSGLLGGSFTYQLAPNSATVGQNFYQPFSPCIPASAVNTAIVLTSTAAAAATATDVNIWGYGL